MALADDFAARVISENLLYEDIDHGELAGATSPTQMPDAEGNLVWFKALASNSGNVYIGKSTVTVAGGGTTGLELAAGDLLGPVPMRNLNNLYYVCDGTVDDLLYWAVNIQ